MADREAADQIEADAARWVLRLDREEQTAAMRSELRDWLAGDSRRRGALLFAQASWRLMDVVAANPTEDSEFPSRDSESPRFFLPRRHLLGALAGLAAALAGVMVVPWGGETYRTGVGEIRRVPLADQSFVAINTASRVTVRFTDTRRRVGLNEGEAWFRVAHNSRRPFLVEAGAIRVQAVGTAFSVRRRSSGAEVLVTEGTVRAWSKGREDQAVLLAAGTSAFLADDAGVSERPNVSGEIDRRLAWRDGLIDLSGQTLSAAAVEFNRYNRRRILVVDEEIGARRLFGVFRTDDPEGFARAAAVSLRVNARGMSSGDIIIEPGRK